MIDYFVDACSHLIAIGNRIEVAEYHDAIFGNWHVEFEDSTKRHFRLVMDNREGWLRLEERHRSGEGAEIWIGRDPRQGSLDEAFASLPKP